MKEFYDALHELPDFAEIKLDKKMSRTLAYEISVELDFSNTQFKTEIQQRLSNHFSPPLLQELTFCAAAWVEFLNNFYDLKLLINKSFHQATGKQGGADDLFPLLIKLFPFFPYDENFKRKLAVVDDIFSFTAREGFLIRALMSLAEFTQEKYARRQESSLSKEMEFKIFPSKELKKLQQDNDIINQLKMSQEFELLAKRFADFAEKIMLNKELKKRKRIFKPERGGCVVGWWVCNNKHKDTHAYSSTVQHKKRSFNV